MSQGRRYALRLVKPVARMLNEYLNVQNGKATTAGSIRRQCSTVGDIETVYCASETRLLTKLGYMLGNGMIEPTRTTSTTHPIHQGKRFYQFILFPPPTWDTDIPWIKWDLFVVHPPANYPVILWQRTGPTGYTQQVYFNGIKRPYRIAHGALWKIHPDDWATTRGVTATELARLIKNNAIRARRLQLKSEEELYNRGFLVPYTEPADRTLRTLSEQLQQVSEIDRRRMLLNNPEA